MSTSTRSKRRKKKNPDPQPKSQPAAAAGGGRLKRYGIIIAILMLLAWLAPMIVAYTPARNYALSKALADLNGKVTSRSASLGWFSPAVLHDVEIRDDRGDLVLSIPTLRTSNTLRQLISNRSHVGHVQIERPRLHVSFDEQGSNLERVFHKYIYSDDEATLTSPAVQVEIIDATADIEDRVARTRWQLEDVGAKLELRRDWSGPLALRAAGKLVQSHRGGHFEARLSLDRQRLADGTIGSSGTVEVTTADLPLAMAQPVLRRLSPDTHVNGWLNGEATYRWGEQTPAGPRMVVDATLAVNEVDVRSPALKTDTLRLAKIDVSSCRLICEGKRLQIEQLAANCDVGNVELRDSVAIDLGKPLTVGLMEAAQNNQYEATGNIDLAKLASLLPQTLAVRPGTQITEGSVRFSLTHQGHGPGAAWQGQLTSSSLSAINQGRPVSWENPIDVQFAAVHTPQGLHIKSLNCRSEFMTIRAQGQPTSLTVLAQYDLDRLAAKLSDFFDLGGTQLSGSGWTQVEWQHHPSGRFEAWCESNIDRFAMNLSGRRPLKEEKLTLNAHLTTDNDPINAQGKRVTTATLSVVSGDDRLKAKLLSPVPLSRAGLSPGPSPTSWEIPTDQTWPVEIDLRGDIARWLARAEPWIGPQNLQMEGDAHVMATLEASPEVIHIKRSDAAISRFRCAAGGWLIKEPALKINARGTLRPKLGQVEIPLAQVLGNSISVEARNASMRLPQAPQTIPTIDGDLAFGADLAQVYRWSQGGADTPPAYDIAGRASGQARFSQGAKTAAAQFQADVQNLSIKPANSTSGWQEPQVTLTGNLRHERLNDSLAIEQLRIGSTSKAVACDARGQITQLGGRQLLDLQGQLTYDLQQLATLLFPTSANEIRFVGGQRPRRFYIQGALADPQPTSPFEKNPPPTPLLARLKAGSEVDWTGADVYGFRFAAGEIRAQLKDGQVLFEPLNLAVNDGRLLARPRIDLVSTPPKLILEGGKLLDRVRITPEMCSRGLKYAMPMLHGVSQAEGQFSVDIQGCVIPLDDPMSGERAGNLTIHDVKFTPGEVLKSIAQSLDAVAMAAGKPGRFASDLRVAQIKRESVVPYRMVDGRVYHKDLELDFGGTAVKTHGWVAMDQSMSLMAKVASPHLVSRVPGLTSMKQTDLSIPITGTLSQPKIDHSRLGETVRGALSDSVREGAADKIRKELDERTRGLFRGLDGLFGPKEE